MWRLLCQHLDSKNVDFSLFWIPGHLDKDVSKVKNSVPGYLFALNHVADAMAGRAAQRLDHPMHIASGVVWYSHVVQKIQRRLVRIIISCVNKLSYEKNIRYPNPQPLPLLMRWRQRLTTLKCMAVFIGALTVVAQCPKLLPI